MTSTSFQCLLTLTVALATVCPACADDVPRWGRFETALENSRTYENPFRDVRLDAAFTSPRGSTVKFFGYYDGVRKGGWGVVLAGGILNYAEIFDGPNAGRPENYGDGQAVPYLKIMFDFLQTLPHADMWPHNELVNDGRICLAKLGADYVGYAPAGGLIELDLSTDMNPFTAQWLNPRTGDVTPCGIGQGAAPFRADCPSADDWVLHFHKRD